MTAASNNIMGNRAKYATIPSDGNAETLFTAVNERPCLVGVVICNKDASAHDVSLIFNDGTTDYPIINEYSLAADEFIVPDLPPIQLEEGESLKVQADAGNVVSFIASVIETGGVSGETGLHAR